MGLYLSGSLSYGDFNPAKRDIDLTVILSRGPIAEELELIKDLHKKIEKKDQTWAKRIECSYIPIDMLRNISPPNIPRPYYNCGTFFNEAHYVNEWIINNYLLYEHGITLIGTQFKELIKAIDIVEVQKACIRDLFQEWVTKTTDSVCLDEPVSGLYHSKSMSCFIFYHVASYWLKNSCCIMGKKRI